MKKLLAALSFVFLTHLSFAVYYPHPALHTLKTISITNTALHGFPAFLFNFIIAFIGAYLIWGILAGPAAYIGTLIITNNKTKRRNGLFGCLLGCSLGLLLKVIKLSQ